MRTTAQRSPNDRLTPDFRRQAREFPKQGSEVALIFESGAEAHFDDRERVVGKKLLRSFDPLLHHELLRGHSGRRSERAAEMELAEICDGRYVSEAEIRIQILDDEFFDPTKFVSGESADEFRLDRSRGSVIGKEMQRQRLDK